MAQTRANQISDLHHRALAHAPADRARFLHDACGDDDALRQEVESLLQFESSADGFLARPAVAALAGTPGSDLTRAFTPASMVGRTLGSYTLTEHIGAGGMGDVYRARDSKLGRDVAIKVLPLAFASDRDRRLRFAREARVLATLNHPHIGAIYGLEEAEGVTALGLELVEGETLAQRLERGPLPVSQSLLVAAQIVDALDAAHEKGIIHRDLKPANIVLKGATDGRSSDLRAKVLDFGIAKLAPGRFEDVATSAGETQAHIVGTPGYMSPEQARGQAVDARTDVWAFGCVLYEMIVGRSAFGGATVSDTIANVLERDPDWQALPPSTPSSIERLLSRCLDKDPKHRLHAIADVNFDLEDARAESGQQRRTAVHRRTRATWVIAVTIVLLASAAAAWQLWSTRSANLPSPRVMPLTSYPGLEASPTFSPDGRQVAFSWDGENGQNDDIYVVMVGADNPLAITSDPARDVAPAWKPDGSVIAFARVESGRASIYLVSPLGGSEKRLTALSAIPYSGSSPIESEDPRLAWSPDGRWLTVGNVMTPGGGRGVFLVGEDGNQELMLKPKPGDNYRMAVLSPTGTRLALINEGIIQIADVGGTSRPTINATPRRLTSYLGYVSGLAWAADGESLLFGRSRYPAPDPPFLWRVSTSDDGTPQRIDLAGVAAYPSISAAASRLAFVRRGLNVDLFRLEEGSPPEALLASSSNEQDESFSSNGSQIAFASDRTGDGHEIWIARADGSNRRPLTNGAHKPEGSPRWSPNDDRLAFDGIGDDGQRRVYLIDPAGGQIQMIPGKPGFRDQVPSWSRDGKWIYFGSNRSGRPEVWRAPVAGGDAEQVTTTGGEYAFESWDGQTLYYLRPIGGVRTVFAMPLPRGPERSLGIQVTFWNYVPVEHGLYYMALRQGQRAPFTYEVRFFDSRSGESRVLHSVRLANASPGLTVTPDGKTVVVSGVAAVTQDLVRIENFR